MEGAFFLFVILAAVGSLLSEYVKAVERKETINDLLQFRRNGEKL